MAEPGAARRRRSRSCAAPTGGGAGERRRAGARQCRHPATRAWRSRPRPAAAALGSGRARGPSNSGRTKPRPQSGCSGCGLSGPPDEACRYPSPRRLKARRPRAALDDGRPAARQRFAFQLSMSSCRCSTAGPGTRCVWCSAVQALPSSPSPLPRRARAGAVRAGSPLRDHCAAYSATTGGDGCGRVVIIATVYSQPQIIPPALWFGWPSWRPFWPACPQTTLGRRR